METTGNPYAMVNSSNIVRVTSDSISPTVAMINAYGKIISNVCHVSGNDGK